MPNPEQRPYRLPESGRTLIQSLVEIKTRGRVASAEPDTLLRAVDYAQNLADEFEAVNPGHPELGLKGREELTIVVYREMMMGKHLRGEQNGR